MTGMTAQARDFWDAQAATFDDGPDHGLRDDAVRGAWRRLLLPLLPAAPALVADLGCGTGTLSVLLAQAGHTVTGLDVAPLMLEAARAKARGAEQDVTFVVGDAADPRLPRGSFEVVLARHVLWALPDAGAALSSWLDLLRPDGLLLLVEGRWSTGAGLTAAQVSGLVGARREEVTVRMLEDPQLWGRAIDDERFLVVSPR